MQSTTWTADAMTQSLHCKKKKRIVPMQFQSKKIYVLGLQKTRTLSIVGYDVTYEHIPDFDLVEMYSRFSQHPEFDRFAYVASMSDERLNPLLTSNLDVKTIDIECLPPHLLKNWKEVMGDTLPHYSCFSLNADSIGKLTTDVRHLWERLCPELRALLDVRNMIFVGHK